jgi:DNA recombination protein RmuC
MDVYLILGIVAIVLLVVNIVLILVAVNKPMDTEEIKSLLRRAGEIQAVQTENIAKQISAGATEQFARFDVIQESVQATLRRSREETNKQLKESLELVNVTLENRVKSLQESNEKRLEQMQGIVDEKLQKTLETRLTQSFELVSKQLESVSLGLGEMKNLAADTKSLKNALMNVRDRGTYGEVRLDKLLSDFLAPGQFEANVEVASGRRVDFAVRLPGNGDEPLYLPIDSKFPIEDYNRLLDAENKTEIDEARKALAQRVRAFAKDISSKYIVPPKTTNFALMFLPTEGLYAEIAQNAALFEELREKYKITVVGATTLSAFLNSLQMGFKTLALEKRSQEVWDTLRSVKAEFNKFGDMLEKARKQLQTADRTLMELSGVRTRRINSALVGVEYDGEEQVMLVEVEDNEIEPL